MDPLTIQHVFELAVEQQRAGRFPEAEQLYRRIITKQPEHVGALHNLGVVAYQVRRYDVALDLIRRAIALRPDYAEAHCSLGNALRDIGQLDEAIAAHRNAIILRPDYAEAHYNLGNALKDKGYLNEAIAACRQAIALRPNLAEAHSNLGNALKEIGQLDEAIACCRQAIALRPNYAEAYSNLGNILRECGQLDDAIACCREAIALRPNDAQAHNNLGGALHDKGQTDAAIAAYRRAIACNHNFAEAYNNLGNALKDKDQLEEAISAFRHAIALRPSFSEARGNMGNALRDKGQIDEAIAQYCQAIALDVNNPRNGSNLLFTLHCHPGYSGQAIAEELRRWSRQHAEPLGKRIGPALTRAHSNDPSPERRLRIGFVSPDFKDHVVGRNILPLFQEHDRRKFELLCYAQVPCPDAITHQFQRTAGCWRNIVGLSDERVGELIREDRIDILVDLALHTANNRLLVFARKAAPVQLSYLGYCGSTGMSAIDYRFSDPYLDPPGTDLSLYSEKTVRLPRSYWCYQPSSTHAISAAPASQSGVVTFGCLNNFAKVSGDTLDLWAKILAGVPKSRMIIHAPAGDHLIGAMQRLQRVGVAPNRLLFVGRQHPADYMQTYSQIDIALDPFPYSGGITTCDALWMGVPVVSLSGQTAVGRGGRSILTNVGLGELVAFTAEQYVRITIDLAEDCDRTQRLRQSMRTRMLASPLMDVEGFAHDVQASFRHMWRIWCQSAPTDAGTV